MNNFKRYDLNSILFCETDSFLLGKVFAFKVRMSRNRDWDINDAAFTKLKVIS